MRAVLPIVVLAGAIGIAVLAIANRPTPERRPAPQAVTAVEAVRLVREDFAVTVRTRGTVRPRTESTLIPEVSGRIVSVSRNFRAGGFFEPGEILVQIDPRNYQVAVTVAEAQLAEAERSLEEESARAQQALRDWERLGAGGAPSDLVLRKPQLAAARAALASAQAQLRQARLDLERTRIRAPYAGRVLEQQADMGQYVSPGTSLARVYAVDYVEIRLPLTDEQLAFVKIPELYRGDAAKGSLTGPSVVLRASIGGVEYRWRGRIVRAEGSIDVQTRQHFVVAQVDDPYGRRASGQPPLKVGQFVEAEIEGNVLKDVFVLPRAAQREGAHVLIVDVEQRLQRRAVDVIWSDTENVVVRDGLKEGELLCVTPVSYAVSGAPVSVSILNPKPSRVGEATSEPLDRDMASPRLGERRTQAIR